MQFKPLYKYGSASARVSGKESGNDSVPDDVRVNLFNSLF